MKWFLLILLSGLLAPAGVYAQEVYRDGSRVILDMTEIAGMPAGAVATATNNESKTAIYDGATPSITTTISSNLYNLIINRTIYEKLEIALHDVNGVNSIGSTNPSSYSWVNAFNYCKGLTTAGRSDWRLPTQRELMMMWIFKPALKSALAAAGGSDFTSAAYWSATEYNKDQACYVYFTNGTTKIYNKSNPSTNYGRVRCVREVTD